MMGFVEGVVLVAHEWDEAHANLLTVTRCRKPIMGYPQMKSLLRVVRKVYQRRLPQGRVGSLRLEKLFRFEWRLVSSLCYCNAA